MKQTKTLDKLINKGFEDTNQSFADCRIYKRNEERVLYNPISDKVDFEYTIKQNGKN